MTDKQQVRVLYTDFLVRHIDAQDEPVNQRRRFLAQWMVDPGLTQMVKGVDDQERKHQRATGRFVPDIMTIAVDGSRARVDDCVDQTNYNVKDVRTDEILTEGDAERFWGVTNLTETSKGWRVNQVGYKDKTCTGR